MQPRIPGGLTEREEASWLAERLLVANARHPLCGPKRARALACVSRATLERAYASGELVVHRPGGKLVVISVLRLAEWIVRRNRRRRNRRRR